MKKMLRVVRHPQEINKNILKTLMYIIFQVSVVGEKSIHISSDHLGPKEFIESYNLFNLKHVSLFDYKQMSKTSNWFI